MKKAKIMLIGIAALGVAGGALAFKAKKFGGVVTVYTCSPGLNPSCSVPVVEGNYTTDPSAPNLILSTTLVSFYTTDPNETCPSNGKCGTVTMYVRV